MAITWIEIDVSFSETYSGEANWNLVQKWPRWGYPQSHLNTPFAAHTPFYELGGRIDSGRINTEVYPNDQPVGPDNWCVTRNISHHTTANNTTSYTLPKSWTWSYVNGLTYTPITRNPHYQEGYDGSKILIYLPHFVNTTYNSQTIKGSWGASCFYNEADRPWHEWAADQYGTYTWRVKSGLSANNSIFSSLEDGDSRFFIKDSGTFQSPGNVYVNDTGTFTSANKIYYHTDGRFREIWPGGYTWHSDFGNNFVFSLMLAYQPTYSGTPPASTVTIKLYEGGTLGQTSENPTVGYGNQQFYVDNPTDTVTVYSGSITPSKLTAADMRHTRLWWLEYASDINSSLIPSESSPDDSVLSGGASQLPRDRSGSDPVTGDGGLSVNWTVPDGGSPVSEFLDGEFVSTPVTDLSDKHHLITLKVDPSDIDSGEYDLTTPSDTLGNVSSLPRYVGIELSWGDPDTPGEGGCLAPVVYFTADNVNVADLDWYAPIHDQNSSGNIDILGETIQYYSRYNQIRDGLPSDLYRSDVLRYPLNFGAGSITTPETRTPWFHFVGGINQYKENTVGIVWVDTWAFKRDNPNTSQLSFNVNGWWRKNKIDSTITVPTDDVSYKVFSLKPSGKLPSYVYSSTEPAAPGGIPPVVKKVLVNITGGTEITSTLTEQAYGLEPKYYFGPIEPHDIFNKFYKLKQFNSGYYGSTNGNIDTRTLVTGDDTNQYTVIDSGSVSVTTNSSVEGPQLGETITTVSINLLTGNISTS